MRLFLYSLIALVLAACGGEDAAPETVGGDSGNNGMDGQFSVRDSMGGGFDSNSPRARIGWAYASRVDLRARNGRISVDGRGMPEEGSAATTELGFNNTTYSMTIEINGESRSVNCKPGESEEDRFERTELTKDRISGSFEVVFVRCTDGNTGQSIDVPGLPVTVTGSFEDLPLND